MAAKVGSYKQSHIVAKQVADTSNLYGVKSSIEDTCSPVDTTFRSSNLAAPTYQNPSCISKKGIFSTLHSSVAPENGRYVARKVLKNKRGYPYRPARLIHYNFDLTKQWYIVFYAWDIGLKKLMRKRVCKEELNTVTDIEQRKETAKELIADLNASLEQDGYLQKEIKHKEVSAFSFHGYKLVDAITWVEEYKRTHEKRSNSTRKEYNYTKATIEDFLKHEGLSDRTLLREVTPTFLQRYCMYLRTERKVANKTYNDRIGSLHTCFETLRKLDFKLWPERNPAARLEKLTTTTKTHAAYTTAQLLKFTELIEPRDTQLLLFIRFIYYTLARPKELRYLKVGHIRLEHSKILMVGEHSKTDYEQYVGVSAEFERLIRASGILNYPDELFVFTDKQHPGPVPTGSGYFYKRFRLYLAQLGFKKLNTGYTLYSFKHTGAVQLYLATKDPFLVQQQLRHKSLDQTNTYLRDLGLFLNFDKLKDWKGF